VLTRDDDYATLGKPPSDWDDRKAREALVDALVRDAQAAPATLDGHELDGPLDNGGLRTDGLRRGRLVFFVDSGGIAAGGVEDAIEEGHRQLRHHGVRPARLLVVSDFCDQRNELLAAVDREPNHAVLGAPREDSAEQLLGLRGPPGRSQAFGKQAFGLQRCAMPPATLQAINPFLRPATRHADPLG
jgi:hypothetical protein